MEPEIRVSTIVRSHDNPDSVVESVRSIFPDWNPDNSPKHSDFPVYSFVFLVVNRIN